jgi:hypothetical protein
LWCGAVGNADVHADTDFLGSGDNSLKAVYRRTSCGSGEPESLAVEPRRDAVRADGPEDYFD